MLANRRHHFARRFLLPVALMAWAACLCGLFAPALSTASTTIGNVGSQNGEVGSFGPGGTATYGQVVVAPAGENSLESFTFYPKQPTAIVFQPYVYAWNNGATGPALYEGPDMHTTEENAFQPITVHTGGVPVTPGDKYIVFFSISEDEALDNGSSAAGTWATVSPGSGNGEFMNNGYNPKEWTSGKWSSLFGWDFEYSAVFGTTPSVSSVSPSSVSGGTQVTVTGANFTEATEVLFGSTPTASFTVNSDNQITATVPSGLSGTVNVRVVTPAGESAVVPTDQVTFAAPSEATTPIQASTSSTTSTPITSSVGATPHCVVPFMRGMDKQAVERALKAADCRLGTIARHYSHMAKGELVEQSLHQTTIAPDGTSVDVWLSLGAPPKHGRHHP